MTMVSSVFYRGDPCGFRPTVLELTGGRSIDAIRGVVRIWPRIAGLDASDGAPRNDLFGYPRAADSSRAVKRMLATAAHRGR
jgi:hypothetical protein